MPPARNTAGFVMSFHGAQRCPLYGSFETCVAHAHRDCNQAILARRTRKRQGSGIVALISLVWVQKGKIGVLPSLEFVSSAVCVELESHCTLSDFLPIDQCCLEFGHDLSLALAFIRVFAGSFLFLRIRRNQLRFYSKVCHRELLTKCHDGQHSQYPVCTYAEIRS